MPGEMRFCPACKQGTYFTLKQSGPWLIYTCRGGCGHTHRFKPH